MARVIAIGGGVGGLATAMLLARDGHDVTVLERDPAPIPDDPEAAWEGWDRTGVNQFRMIHYLLPRFRQVVERELPDVVGALEAIGALRYNPVAAIPAEITGGPAPGDEQFESVTARRPVAETAVARAATRTPGVTIRRGVAVTGLLRADANPHGVAHVIGVRTDAGDLPADLVIDAAGRRSSLPAMLTAIGARPPAEEKEDCGFVYYGRHFRSADGSTPPIMAPLLAPWGSVSTLTLPADNGTWGLAIVASARDAPLRKLKDPDTWMRAWAAFPLVAHWSEGEPIDGGRVAVMAKIEDRHRSFVTDGVPVATGVLAVADSWACTNPSLGRGISIGLLHAVALRDLLRDGAADDPLALATRWHDVTLRTVEPWYRATLDFDRHRLAEIDAIIDGKPYEPDDPGWEILQAMQHAAGQDSGVLRGSLRIAGLLATAAEVLADPALRDKVVTLGRGWRDAEMLAPSRAELVAIAAA